MDPPFGRFYVSYRRFLITFSALAVVGLATLMIATTLPVNAEAADVRVRKLRTLKDSRIVESSGLALSGYNNRRLWTHNDSGGGPWLYAVGRHGRTTGRYYLTHARAWDWEAMASAKRHGNKYLFVGEIGDNRKRKSSIFVHRIREPKPSAPNGKRNPDSYELKYPDGAHDAEALLVRPGSLRIYIVTKVKDGPGHVYVAPKHPSQRHLNRLKKIGKAPSVITDGVFLNRHRYVLRGYGSAWVYRKFGAHARKFSLPHSGESIARSPRQRYVFVGSEGRRSGIWRVRLPPR